MKPAAAAAAKPPVLAIARIDGGRAVVADPAQGARLHAKGSVGELAPNGALSLSLVEAALSVAEGRLALMEGAKQLALADVLALGGGSGGGHRTEMEYLVYRDLRERGLVVRPVTDGRAPAGAPGSGRFAVWPRGTSQGDPAFHAVACADADGLPVDVLAQAAADKSVLSVADADGAITHYQAALDAPAGDVPPGDLPRAKGAVLADRVLVSDPGAVAAYSSREFLGTRHGGDLFLSFVEAESLRLRGVLSVPPGLAARGEGARLLPVHVALRNAGAVPKSGFKFGTHMRAYRNAPDDGHAEWLVHVADPDETLPWSALSRGVRLAHGVRKKFLVAIPGEAGHPPTFAQLSWYRP
ncbi:MAG: tRNA-intron endonuclease, archaea type [Thermoplasmata archaeon]|nr:tRNA-intron endonuclease, archaea type [Thermoplasmata archaeon]